MIPDLRHDFTNMTANDVLTLIENNWMTNTVCGICVAIQGSSDNDLLPVLADALEDAGCDYIEMLLHLRYGHIDNITKYVFCNTVYALQMKMRQLRSLEISL